MVLLHVKRSEKEGFLYEVPAATEVDTVLRDLCKIHNLRLRVNRLTEAAGQLALYGPMKLPEQQGLDDETPLLEDYDVKSGETVAKRTVVHSSNYRQDPSEKRTGDAPSDELAAVINQTVEDAKALTSDQMLARKQAITIKPLEDAINNIRGAVMIVYPMGLPDYDHVRFRPPALFSRALTTRAPAAHHHNHPVQAPLRVHPSGRLPWPRGCKAAWPTPP
jgi:cilia- and flagella-associated protein 298